MNKNLAIIIISSAIFFTLDVQAASFNCSKAQSSTEKRICDDLILNDADVKMLTTYNIVRRLVPMGTRSEIQTEQFRWLQLRNDCLDNVECLSHVYQMRQQQLEIHMDRIYRKGPF